MPHTSELYSMIGATNELNSASFVLTSNLTRLKYIQDDDLLSVSACSFITFTVFDIFPV